MFLKKYDKICAAALIAISVIMNSISYFKLPAMLVMQIKSDGSAGTTLPTLMGLIIMSGLVLIFSMLAAFIKEDKSKGKYLALAVLILILNGITIFMNI